MVERELILDSGGVTIRGTVVLPSRRGEWPLALLCHGIPSGAAPVPGDTGYEALAGRCVDSGVAACYFNFRGTGLSEGDFSLGGWSLDLDAVLDAARSARGAFEGCGGGIVLMGFSGGGAISIICAARRKGLAGVASLSSPATFSRLLTREGMGDFIAHARSIGIIRDPFYPPSQDRYYEELLTCNPVDCVGRVAPTPLLVIHGDEDDTVPVDEAHRLYEAAAAPKELYVVKGGGHKLRLNLEAMDRAIGWTLDKLKTTPLN